MLCLLRILGGILLREGREMASVLMVEVGDIEEESVLRR